MNKKLKVWFLLCAVSCSFTPAAFCAGGKDGDPPPPPKGKTSAASSDPSAAPTRNNDHGDTGLAIKEPSSTEEYMRNLMSDRNVMSSRNVWLGEKELRELSDYIKRNSSKRNTIFEKIVPQLLYQFKYDPDGSDIIMDAIMGQTISRESSNARKLRFAFVADDGRGVCRDATSYLDFIAEMLCFGENDKAVLRVAPDGPYSGHLANMIKLGNKWWVYDLTLVGYPQELETFIERVAPGPWRKQDRLCVHQWIKCGSKSVCSENRGDVFEFAFGKLNPHIAENTIKLEGSTLVIGRGLTEISDEYIAHVEKYIKDSKWANNGEKRSNIKIKTIKLDKGVKIMHPFAFAYCDRIDELDMSESEITSIPKGAFCGSKIKSIKFNKGTNNIGKYAFSGMFKKDSSPTLINFAGSPFAIRHHLTEKNLFKRGNIPGGICAQYNIDCFESQDLISSPDDIEKIKSTVGVDPKTGRTVIGKGLAKYRADSENTLDLKYIRTLLLLGIIDKNSNITISSDVERIEDRTFDGFSCDTLDMSRLLSDTHLSPCCGVFVKDTNIERLILPDKYIVEGHLGFCNGAHEGDNVVIKRIEGPLHSFHLLQPSYWRKTEEFEITDEKVSFKIENNTLTIKAPKQKNGATYGPSHYLALWHRLSQEDLGANLNEVKNVELIGPWLAIDGGSDFYVLDKGVNNIAFKDKTFRLNSDGEFRSALPQVWTTDDKDPRKNIVLKADLPCWHGWHALSNTPNVVIQSNEKAANSEDILAKFDAKWNSEKVRLEMTSEVLIRSTKIDEAVAAARGLNKEVDTVYVHDTNLKYDYKRYLSEPTENHILSSCEFACRLPAFPACPNLVQNIVVGSNTEISLDKGIEKWNRTGKGMGFFEEQNVLFSEDSSPSWSSVKACFDCGMNVFMHPNARKAMISRNQNSGGNRGIPESYLERIKDGKQFPSKKA